MRTVASVLIVFGGGGHDKVRVFWTVDDSHEYREGLKW